MTSQPERDMTPAPARITQVRRETRDTFTVHLEREDRAPFYFQPGQFNMVYAFGVGEVPVSLSGDPHDTGRIVHTIRRVGRVTQAMQLRRGQVLGVRGPYGRGFPLDEARGRDLLIVVGGLGLAPLRPVLCHVMRHRGQFGRVALVAGARTPDDLLFRRELTRFQRRIQVLTTVDRASADWSGHVGVVTQRVGEAQVDPRTAVALVCGPEVMMRFCERELSRRGFDDTRIHLSLERNMKCALGFCGRCQLGPGFLCKDGPVVSLSQLRPYLNVREL